MCLYSRESKNKRYYSTKKNGGVVPKCNDDRQRHVGIDCGRCIECRKKKKREWQIRLVEELKTRDDAKYVTLTFTNENLKKLEEEYPEYSGYELDNMVAKRAVKLFRERWRKKYGESIRHWLVTELGGHNSERLHMHGLLFTDESVEVMQERWGYGNLILGDGKGEHYVNEKTVSYIVKYINKVDEKHSYYNSIVLTSPGMGKAYVDSMVSRKHIYKGKKTVETYQTRSGHKMALPRYYRLKLWNEEERRKLWSIKLNENVRYLGGIKYKLDEAGEKKSYEAVLEAWRMKNNRLGYGNNWKNYEDVYNEGKRRATQKWYRDRGIIVKSKPETEKYMGMSERHFKLNQVKLVKDWKECEWDRLDVKYPNNEEGRIKIEKEIIENEKNISKTRAKELKRRNKWIKEMKWVEWE